jgi:uncharacterized protein (DUF488 family)
MKISVRGGYTVVMDGIFTIGHSTHRAAVFMQLLRDHAIEMIVDVRSTPFSRRNPQFNQNTLRATLEEAGIGYLFLGRELGARSEDEECYVDNKVQYACLARTGLFQSGIARLIEEASRLRVALMCAEKEPLECHRTILVTRELARRGLPVTHILADSSLETHEEAMQRLVRKLRLKADGDLFRTGTQLMEEAYDLQGSRIAYRRDK